MNLDEFAREYGRRPRLLDTYCCQGGASHGYALAGFDVVGVDLDPQPRYPYEFHQGDAVAFIRQHGHEFDVITGSPPCQGYSVTQVIQGNDHPKLIEPTRQAMIESGKLYVIENVAGARSELRNPGMLCGTQFGLHTYRHRLFESNAHLLYPAHQEHTEQPAEMGRPVAPGQFYHAVGNFSSVALIREDMGVPWMSRDGIRECIPPAYTQFLGEQLLLRLGVVL